MKTNRLDIKLYWSEIGSGLEGQVKEWVPLHPQQGKNGSTWGGDSGLQMSLE